MSLRVCVAVSHHKNAKKSGRNFGIGTPTPRKNIGFGSGAGIAKRGGYPLPIIISHSKKTLNFGYCKHLKFISYV